jgi:hypothetical protein
MAIETFRNRPTRALISLGNLANNFAIARSLEHSPFKHHFPFAEKCLI